MLNELEKCYAWCEPQAHRHAETGAFVNIDLSWHRHNGVTILFEAGRLA